MEFCWYVWFYILLMVVLPLFGIIEKQKSALLKAAFFIILVVVIDISARKIPEIWALVWFPYAIVGYFAAKCFLLEKCCDRVKSRKALFLLAILLVALSVTAWNDRLFLQYCSSISPFLMVIRCTAAPLFILAVIFFTRAVHVKAIGKIFEYLGKHSMNIWFIHCIFFSAVTRSVVQPIVFVRDNPIWIFCIVVVISLALSCLITPLQQYINKRILAPIFAKVGL